MIPQVLPLRQLGVLALSCLALRNVTWCTDADGMSREKVKLAAVSCSGRPGGRVAPSAWVVGADEALGWYGRVHTTPKRVPDDKSKTN